MKKYLSLVMIGLSLMLSGCNKDDNNDPDTPPTGDTGKVRYEATVSDPENFKLLIHYTVGVDISSEAPEEADTFSACTGEKPGRYLIPYFSGFYPTWAIREHYYDTKK